MKAVVQRVSSAECKVDGETLGSIQQGLLVFLGIHRDDSESDAAGLADKIVDLRIFSDAEGKMNRDLDSVDGSLLVVPNFTLYADLNQGRRPSFDNAASPERARGLYETFLTLVEEKHSPVESGRFGAMMSITAENDGPVTIVVDSRDLN